MSSLIEMPELVMEKIIEFSDFKSVLTLRQVCCDFRNFIDDLNNLKLPDSKFERITLIANNSQDSIILIYQDKNDSQKQYYCGKSDSRSFNGKAIDLGSSNIVDVAVRDLKWVLKFQKSALERLFFHFEDFQPQKGSSIHTLLIELITMFGKLHRRIKTRKLMIQPYDASQVTQLLQSADPETLEIISIFSLGKELETESDRIVKTEQWKKAEILHCHIFLMNVNVEDVCHFSWISLKTNSLDVRDFDTLKKTFVSSSKFEGARIELKNFNEEEELSYIWGPGFYFDRARKWYFRMKEFEEKILLVEATHPFPVILQGYYRINFDICEMTDVPNGAIVQDYNEN